MGDDFAALKIYAGRRGSEVKAAVQSWLEQHLREQGYQPCAPEEATRSLVLGPAGPWLHLGDTTGSTMWQDKAAFAAVARGISGLADTVHLLMSDSSVFHLYLWRAGEMIDQYGNGLLPFHSFVTGEDAGPYRGVPELWTFAASEPLTQAFQKRQLHVIAEVLGWPRQTLQVGYTQDWDGIPVIWRELIPQPHHEFTELHFEHPDQPLMAEQLRAD